MPKIIFTNKNDEDISSIPNKQIEQMFLSIADDSQMVEFNRLIEKGLIHTASAYASQRVMRTFQYFRDTFIQQGGDLEYLQFMLYRKNK
jgi:hypothetical protein